MKKGSVYYTPEKLKMNTWTRKDRIKFKKRWKKQHGSPFYWMQSEYVYAAKPFEGEMIFHIRED